jgi:hypothetical protein
MVANPDRDFTADDYDEQYNNISALREALGAASADATRWKAKFEQAKWKALVDRNEVLEDEKKKLLNDRKVLRDENGVLRDEIMHLRRQRTSPGRESPPMMSGASPQEPPKISRTMSTKKGKEKEQDDQKKRMSQRFEREDQGHATSSSRQGQREGYVEPWGPGGRPAPPGRPRRSSSIAAPTSRGAAFPTNYNTNYTTAQDPAPIYASPRSPTYASIPRNVNYDPEYPGNYDDGSYRGLDIPLPETRHGHRGRRP